MRFFTIAISLLTTSLFLSVIARAQTTDDILNLLTKKGTISVREADSIRREYATKQRQTEATADSFPLRLGRLVSLSGYMQTIYTNYEHQLAGKYYDGFSIKRARLDFQGHFSSQFDYRMLVDFVGQSGANGTAPTGGQLISPFLVEAYIVYKPFTFLNFKAGQMIVAFSQENMTQDRNLYFIERSQVVNALVARKGDAANGLVDSLGNQNGRDIGIQAGGSIIKIKDYHLLDYTLQVLNGAGINSLDNNSNKDIDGRLIFHPIKALSLGGSYYHGSDVFTSSLTKTQRRIRWGTELALNLDGLDIKGEYIRGWEGDSKPINHQGWYGQAAYFVIPKHLQALFRYDWYDSNMAKSNVNSTYYDFGLDYFFNVWTKLSLYYSLRNQDGPTVNNNMFEAQLQLGF
jgi:phosphate-selective porin OprO and OprP